MKILKWILGVIVFFIALLLIIALIVPRRYEVEREISINSSIAEVFDYVKYLKNQDNFSTWAKLDMDMIKEFRGIDGESGFVTTWESENKEVGKGEQEILKITEGERIDYELRFLEPFKSTDYAFISTEAIDSTSTLVTWNFNGKMKYPMNLMLLVMDMNTILGGQLEEGLQNLKIILESE